MDEERLAKTEERANAATPGPWEPWPIDPDDSATKWSFGTEHISPDDLYEADAAFIASARTDITELISEVRRLQTALQWIANDKHETNWCLSSPDCCNCHRDHARQALEITE